MVLWKEAAITVHSMRGLKLGVVSVVPLKSDLIHRHFIMSGSWTLREQARSIKKWQLHPDLPPLGMWPLNALETTMLGTCRFLPVIPAVILQHECWV